MRTWTDEEIEILKRDYSFTKTILLAETLNKKYRSVINKARYLGLKKDRVYLQKMILNTAGKGEAHQFKKGHIPKNKGKKQVEYMTNEAIERTKATRFKKGHKPHNTKNDGYITIRKCKRGFMYKWIKKDGIMRPYNVFLWEKHNGDVPKGFNVVFKDKNNLNCTTIENLDCISKKENMARNSINNYPLEFKKEINKLAKLKRTIKKVEQLKNK
jgi:hypothetical protein